MLRPVLLLSTALVLAACAAGPPGTTVPPTSAPPPASEPAAVATGLGALLGYSVTSGPGRAELTASVFQNDASGIGYRFDLDDGARTGTVLFDAASVERATIVAAGFVTMTLTDKTSLWLARAPFARLRGGDPVGLTIDGYEERSFSGACNEAYTVGTAGGSRYDVPACRFTAGDQTIVVADDAAQPLILSLDNGLYLLTLEAAAAR